MTAARTSQAVWDGAALARAFTFAASLLEQQRDRINALNVFPVPDGDTGTNMSLTMTAALEALDELDNDASAADVAARMAYGALMGARGNSGVILSQFFRGFDSGLGDTEQLDGRDIANALESSRQTAYKAVMRPVEGTMLSVIKAAAHEAKKVSHARAAVADVLIEAHRAAETALQRTPEQLDILRQAGVVDAGGQGIVCILDGLARSAMGETSLPERQAESPIAIVPAYLDMVDDAHGANAYGYCTNFLVTGSDIDANRCRDELAAMGDSAVIVGDQTMLKVHIHTPNPGEILEYAVRLGDLDQIKIDNMNKQTEDLATSGNKTYEDAPPAAVASNHDTSESSIAIIAVAAGAGVSDALRSLGATHVITGGQTMNPSTQELLQAVESASAADVILLPNNKNIIMAANQVDELTEKTVRVIPTRSIPAALAALTAFNFDHPLDHNITHMEKAANDVAAISITSAVRNVELNGVDVREGQTIGLINDDLVAAGDDELEVIIETLSASEMTDPELLTVFVGEHVAARESDDVHQRLSCAWPDAEIELHDGGQPHYRYIISAE